MSLVSEILDRLTGLSALRERVDRTSDQVEKLAEWNLELDRRVTRMEASVTAPRSAKPSLPKTTTKSRVKRGS